ncbi:hypothetical protein KY334_02625 [Candidatus Woesearchaeota archaeon]|nr:hypothetical protein [Candidatus Woesearchaeota archaeon]
MDDEYYVKITKMYILIHEQVEDIENTNLNECYLINSNDFSKLKELKGIINKSLCEYYDLLDEIKEEKTRNELIDLIDCEEKAELERIEYGDK